MGNNISKPKEITDWTKYEDNEINTPERHVSNKNDHIIDQTNSIITNYDKQNQKINKTDEQISVNLKETDAFNANKLKPAQVLNKETENNNYKAFQKNKDPAYIRNENNKLNMKNTVNKEIIQQQVLDIIERKNSDVLEMNAEFKNMEKGKNGKTANIDVTLLESEINKNIEENIELLNEAVNIDSGKTSNNLDEKELQITFIDDLQDEEESVKINDKILKEHEKVFKREKDLNDINTEVSILVKEAIEMICIAEKENKPRATEKDNAVKIGDQELKKSWLSNKTAGDTVVGELTTNAEVNNDVKRYPTNNLTSTKNSEMICCQKQIAVVNTNQQPSKECENKFVDMLSVSGSNRGLETFSSSPPKVVTDSETEEDSSNKEYNITENDENEINIKIKKHVHWADTEGRTLESFEKCSNSEDEDDDDDDDYDVNNELDEEDENEETSSEDEESSSEDEIIEVSPAVNNNITYKREDTWLDVTEDKSQCNASDQSKNEDSDDEEQEDEEESSEEESSDSGDDNEEKEDDGEKITELSQIDNKVDLNGSIQINELCEKIAKLQEEIMIKASSLERQRCELEAAYRESESVQQKYNQLEDELHEYKCRNNELTLRMCDAESKLISEGDKEKLKAAEKKIVDLENEIDKVKMEKYKLEESIKKLEKQHSQEIDIVRKALDDSLSEQEAMETRYKIEFEQLRSLNSNREVQMLDDFEWKLREVEKLGKKKLLDTEKELTDRIVELTAKLEKVETELSEVAHLKLCEIELKQLRVTAHETRKNLRTVTRQLEDLQVDEKILQEEVNRLRTVIDREKAQFIALQNSHKEELAEKDRKTQFKLQVQKNQLNSEWEEKLKRECARLQNELEKGFREEKMVAIETEKRIRDHELINQRQIWESKMEDLKLEINKFKKKIEDKEEQHRNEMENAQTHSDRDVLDLRRKIDKLDMQYQEKIEKLQESHEQEIAAVRQECEKKVFQCESSVQMQLGTTRTTLELVKQQMANEREKRIEHLKRLHQQELQDQWLKVQRAKETDIAQLEIEHRRMVELLERKLEEYKKRNNIQEVSTANTNISKLFNTFMKLFHQAPTSNLNNQPSKDVIKAAHDDATVSSTESLNKDQTSSRDERMPVSRPNSSAVELELRQTVEKLSKQIIEDQEEIERLKEQIPDGAYFRQQQTQRPQQQPSTSQQHHHHHRRSRKSRSFKN